MNSHATACFPAKPTLSKVEEHFGHLVAPVKDYAIFLLDPQGCIATWNAGAEQIVGYQTEEILGQHFSCLFTPDAIASGWPEHELHVATEEGQFSDEGWRVRKDGSWFWASVVITALHDEAGAISGFLKISRDFTQRRHAEEALRRSEDRLRQLVEGDRQKNEFLTILAHELRNPLAPIVNGLQVIKQLERHDSTIGKVRDIMEREVRHLTRLLDDLLDHARIAHGKIELRKEAVDLATIVKETADSTRSLLEERRQELTMSLPPRPTLLEADATRLKQILTNLLNNASRHNGENQRLFLSADTEGEQVVMRIRAPGMSIPVEMLARIFEPFEQLNTGAGGSHGDLGIGLNIARRLVELHGGTLEALIAASGQGSEFVVRLPAVWDQEASDASPTRSGVTRPIPASPKRRILIVDDNEDAAKSLAMLLRLEGHEVTLAYNGPEALAGLETEPPEMVFLDIKMPGMSGYEVAERMRQTPGMEKAVLVALTGYGQEEDKRRSQEAGFDYHLVKPVEPEALKKLLAVTSG